jgi:hypothetical protein
MKIRKRIIRRSVAGYFRKKKQIFTIDNDIYVLITYSTKESGPSKGAKLPVSALGFGLVKI